jgi:hypothetical protein
MTPVIDGARRRRSGLSGEPGYGPGVRRCLLLAAGVLTLATGCAAAPGPAAVTRAADDRLLRLRYFVVFGLVHR